MSHVISVQEAASILPKLIKRATEGGSVLIGDDGKAEVSLQPTRISQKKDRTFGFYSEKITIADDFDAPLPDDILEGFGYK